MSPAAESLTRTIRVLDRTARTEADLLDPVIFAVVAEAVRRLGRERAHAIVHEALEDAEAISHVMEEVLAERASVQTLRAAANDGE